MIVIGIDPHKSTHTATAVDSATKQGSGFAPDPGVVRRLRPVDDLIEAVAGPDLGGGERLGHRPPSDAVADRPG